MDNLAHTLAGAVLAEAGLKRRTGLATATLLIGANLPDLDVVAAFVGSGLAFRRGWTHGVLALFVLPVLLTLAMLAWNRWARPQHGAESANPVIPRQLLLVAFLGVFSHSLLDWLNTYGLRWLMPFDGTWFYGDALFIVDPYLWLILFAGVVLSRRRRDGRPSRIALGVAVGYIALMTASGLGGRIFVDRGVRDAGLRPEEIMVGPVALNPNRRQVILLQEGEYLLGTLDWLPTPRLRIEERTVRINGRHPVVMLAMQHPDARDFLGWSRYPFFIVTQNPDGISVLMDDLRYSDGMTPSWAAVQVDFPLPGGSGRPGEFEEPIGSITLETARPDRP